MSSISDALKRAEQERERLRAPAGEAAPVTEHPPASLASVVLGKPKAVKEAAAVAEIPAPPPVTPLADAIKSAPVPPPPVVRAQQQAAETIVEDYASKRKLNLPHSVVVYHDRSGAAAEQYRKIRDTLMAGNTKREHQMLVITSAATREGKTITALNLGLSLAEIRANRVLIVDGVMHSETDAHDSLTEILKLRTEQGLAELLLDADEDIQQFIKATPWHNLFVLPSGAKTTAGATAQLLQSQNLRAVVRQLRSSFDWILVDAPNALKLPDAGLLGAAADGMLLAAALHHTPEGDIQTVIRRLKSMNLPLKSAILTRA